MNDVATRSKPLQLGRVPAGGDHAAIQKAELQALTALRQKHGPVSVQILDAHYAGPGGKGDDGHTQLRPTPVDAVNYARIRQLFTDELTRQLDDRHVDVLVKLARVYKQSTIPQEHVDSLGHVFSLALARIETEGVASLVDPLEALIELSVRDLCKLRLTLPLVDAYCSLLGSPSISSAAKRNILKVASTASLANQFDMLAQLLPSIHSVLCSLDDPRSILKLLLVWSDSPAMQLRMSMLDLSTPLRDVLTQVADPVVRLLAMQLATRIVQPDKETVEDWIPVLGTIQADVALTNDVLLFVCDILAANPKHCPDLVDFVLNRTTFELSYNGDGGQAAPPIPPPPSPLALESKQVGLRLIELFLEDAGSRGQLLAQQYADFCFGYLTFQLQDGFDQGWALRDLKQIQATCLAHLTTLFAGGDLFADAESISCDPAFSAFLREAQVLDNGTADRPNAVNASVGLVPRFLHLMRTLCTYGPSVQVKLGELGLVHECVTILTARNTAWITEGVRRSVCMVLAALCDGECRENQLLVAQTPAVFHLVHLVAWTSAHPARQELMRLAVLDAVWSAVCGCRLNEESFLEAGGVFRLLDLLAAAERAVQSHLLSVLLELLENPKTHQHVVTWSSSKYPNAPALLLDLWRNEKAQLKFDRNLNAIDEMRINFCCKIFGILSHTGFNIFRHQLNESDQQLLLSVERYLDLKIGVVWDEIAYELSSEGIRPVSPDQHVLDSVKHAVAQKRDLIARMQADLGNRFQAARLEAESVFYDDFMRAHQVSESRSPSPPRPVRRNKAAAPREQHGGGGPRVSSPRAQHQPAPAAANGLAEDEDSVDDVWGPRPQPNHGHGGRKASIVAFAPVAQEVATRRRVR
ncbi:hypothetical protein H9P43_003416 [Blastocladiella emersonii ATCC 22665]|nr:hypothetical protein H9P43_003416 [Blastocladiella emersonii ATCC 22665]